jgi:hypothetical protein
LTIVAVCAKIQIIRTLQARCPTMKSEKQSFGVGMKPGRSGTTARGFSPAKVATPEQQQAAGRLLERLQKNVSVTGWKPYVKGDRG